MESSEKNSEGAIKAANEQPNKRILRIEPQSRFPKGKKRKNAKFRNTQIVCLTNIFGKFYFWTN